MKIENQKVVAEISIIPLGKNYSSDELQTSISKEIAFVFNAIKKFKEVKVNLTAMGTEMEADTIQDILKAVEFAHQSLKDLGIKRIISTIRIDERLDKTETLEDRVNSVNEKLTSIPVE
ncbi:MAG: MTH1187 family thiamine-binding protein [Nitrosopumilus sp.]|nr:MTH1187 family thiamine-binding protein [Nitrosopumilus sp.]